jgi:prepilin-type N-terminal cleavage/methylation domain-containing protein
VKRGFTLIEIRVAMSIFAIVALVATSALLTANRVNQKAQALKVVTDSLNFALNSMSFKMRQGKNYRCIAPATAPIPLGVGASCTGGQAIAFETPKWPTTNPPNPTLTVGYRVWNQRLEYWTLANGWQPITVNNLMVQKLNFTVEATAVPRVLISINGTASSSQLTAPFQLETLVSERL